MRCYVVDAFTDAAFAGNPAAVVPLDEPADAAWMQRVAAEFNLSETAFPVRRADGGYDLRWFTPVVEVDLCGHATLASAHLLGTASFHTRSGILSATVDDGTISLDFPAQPVHEVPAPDGLFTALGIPEGTVFGNGADLLVETDDVASVAPDFGPLARVECRGVIVTTSAPESADHDFVSRFFAPRVGVPEDPVTGSAHCALAPYWSARLGRSVLTGVQLSARGGRVGVEVRGDRVVLHGRAVTVLEGMLLV